MNTSRIEAWLCVPLMLITVVLSAWAHTKAGLTLPSPWSDESWIMWKALAFSQSGTLFSEHINPERMIITFPVYETLLGVILKFFPFSLETGRWVSWFFVILSYPAWLVMLTRSGRPLIPMGVVSLFYLNSTFTVTGNMIRPEAALLAGVAWSFAFLARGRVWPGFVCAALGFLVHPAGAIFSAMWVLAWLITARPFFPKPSRSDIIWMIVLTIITITLAIHLILHWSSFVIDYGSADSEHMGNRVTDRLFSKERWPYLILFALLMVYSAWRKKTWIPLIAVGLSSYAIMVLRAQMWYEVYVHIGFLVLAVMLPLIVDEVVVKKMKRSRWWSPTVVSMSISLLGLLPVSYLYLQHGFFEGPRSYPTDMKWGWGMRVYDRPYLDQVTRDTVIKELDSRVGTNRHVNVLFVPEADALLYHGLLTDAITLYQPIRTRIEPDWLVLRTSPFYARWYYRQSMKQLIEQYSITDADAVYATPHGDRWYIFRVNP